MTMSRKSSFCLAKLGFQSPLSTSFSAADKKLLFRFVVKPQVPAVFFQQFDFGRAANHLPFFRFVKHAQGPEGAIGVGGGASKAA